MFSKGYLKERTTKKIKLNERRQRGKKRELEIDLLETGTKIEVEVRRPSGTDASACRMQIALSTYGLQ